MTGHMTGRVITIDGPAGSGKSTAARGVAKELGLHTLDTGAMYRAVTLAALQAGVDVADGLAVARIARDAQIDLEDGLVRLDGRDVSAEIRGPEVTSAVSAVSSHPAVRAILVAHQRAWIDDRGGGVVEGRDIGTVVFPNAPVKVFLTARDDVRAVRRRLDEQAAAREIAVGEVRDALTARDNADASLGRALRPEDAARDAMIMDTTNTTVGDVVAAIVARFREEADQISGESTRGSA
jgi:cytidylate kinase